MRVNKTQTHEICRITQDKNMRHDCKNHKKNPVKYFREMTLIPFIAKYPMYMFEEEKKPFH